MASRFWVGGTGTWDAADTTHWAASSGGAGGQSVPGSSDTVTFDANSGGGTVTLNFGGTITIQSIAMGAFTGTWDNSVNNNNMTLSAGANAFNGSGSGVRTIKLGTATYTLTANNATWSVTTAANLTYNGSSATINFTGTSGARALNSSSSVALSHGNVSFAASTGVGACSISGGNTTYASLSIAAPNSFQFPSGVTTTISSAFQWLGSSSAQMLIQAQGLGSAATVAATAGSIAAWSAFRDMTFTGSPSAADSFNIGNNSGITVTPPSGGAGFSASFF